MTLTDFLLARIAEDKQSALRATRGPWEAFRRGDPSGPFGVVSEWAGDVDSDVIPDTSGGISREDAEFVARHNPDRALTEWESKKRIVNAHVYTDDGRHMCAHPGGGVGQWSYEGWEPCVTLAALALPYADHPDYDEEWRP